jgi:hypothetical protein
VENEVDAEERRAARLDERRPLPFTLFYGVHYALLRGELKAEDLGSPYVFRPSH